MKHPTMLVLVLAASLLILSPASSALVYVKQNSPGPMFDGTSWETAFHTIQEGVNASQQNDEVRVAKGYYAETITVKNLVQLKGGYSGQGDTRDISIYRTTVDAKQNSLPAFDMRSAYQSSVDGFIIRGGNPGVYCSYSSSTITNNVFIDNIVGVISEGIDVVANNIFINCGTGLRCSGGTKAMNNAFLCCTKKAVEVTDYSTNIGYDVIIANNIIAYNRQVGIDRSMSVTKVTLSHNNVFANETDYQGLSKGVSDISIAPEFVCPELGDFHIVRASPCRDAGDNAYSPVTDMDGQNRYEGTAIDIGPDESYGEEYPEKPRPRTVYVDQSVPQSGDGTSWNSAYKTILEALNDVSINGTADVWVAEGTYSGPFVVPPFAHLFGGFRAGDTWEQRDFVAKVTVLNRSNYPETAKAIAMCTIDGFNIPNGDTGIYCQGSFIRVSNNEISGNTTGIQYAPETTITGNTITGMKGSGMSGAGNGVVIEGNTVTGCQGDGIDIRSGTATVVRNVITRNGLWYNNYSGIRCSGLVPSTICDNLIANNKNEGITSLASSSKILRNRIIGNGNTGISCSSGSTPLIANNFITGHSKYGVNCSSANPNIYNNTFAANDTAIYATGTTAAKIKNNIIVTSKTAVYCGSTNAAELSHNNLFKNYTNYNPANLPHASDTTFDPKFAHEEYGELHILANSQCRNAGDDSVLDLLQTDIDGQARKEGISIDIGADESYGEEYTEPYDPAIVYVDASAPNGGDGTSWSKAMKTVQAGIDAGVAYGGCEVWVAEGNYPELVILRPFVHLYGGYSSGDTRADRNPAAKPTVIDCSSNSGPGTKAVTGANHSTIDGFVVKGGETGILCDRVSPAIRNNHITQSSAAIVCTYSSPDIIGNRITGSGIAARDGIICNGTSTPRIANNMITDKNYSIRCSSGPMVISNNTIIGNMEPASFKIGVMGYTGFDIVVSNNIIAMTSRAVQGGISLIKINNNCFYGNEYSNTGVIQGPGNIYAAPLFTDIASGDFRLLPGSPCIDAGDTGVAPLTDIEGGLRPKDGNGDGRAITDIGCFEMPNNYKTIADVKALPDGTSVGISSPISTAVFSDRFYVESRNIPIGIGVMGSCSSTGKMVTIEGTMATVEGERVIQPSYIKESSSSTTPRPFYLNADAIGGGRFGLQDGVMDYRMPDRQLFSYGGANNTGLLIKTTGLVTNAGATSFYLAGCSFDDGDENIKGIKVDWPFSEAVPSEGSFVEVTAVSSCTLKNGILVRMLRPVSPQAIRLLSQ